MKLLHVTIQTDRFEEELHFYQEIAGLRIIRDMREHGRNMIFLADRSGECEIEIIENPNAQKIESQSVSIGFQTEDVTKKYEELRALGYDVGEMIRPSPHVQFFFVKDPAGLNVQFM